jgi:hypothetical protein
MSHPLRTLTVVTRDDAEAQRLMARRSDSSLAALLLTQRLVETPAAPLKPSEYWSVLDLVGDPVALIAGDPSAVARSAGVEAPLADRIAELVGAATAFAFALEDQEQSGLRVIASVDDDYPAALVERLGRGAPPLLYVVGDAGLLATSMVGMVRERLLRRPPTRHAGPQAKQSPTVWAWSRAAPRVSTAWPWERRWRRAATPSACLAIHWPALCGTARSVA